MNKQLGRVVTMGAFALLASGAWAQGATTGSQNTGGTGQPGTTNSGDPNNMKQPGQMNTPSGTPSTGTMSDKMSPEHRAARAACDKGQASDRTKCYHEADGMYNKSGGMKSNGMGNSNMGSGSMSNGSMSNGSANPQVQNKCAALAGTDRADCMKASNSGK